MLNSSWIVLSLLYFCGWFGSVNACSEHAVKKAIFDGYDRVLRPVKNQSTVTVIYVQSDIYNILSVDGQDEMIELLVWSTLTWTDEFLQWNPSDFDGCEKISVLGSEIWIPDYTYLETLEMIDVGINDYGFIHISSKGTATLLLNIHATFYCKMDIANFPFDTQTCTINGASSTFSSSDFMIRRNTSTHTERVYSNNSEFETVSFSCEEDILIATDNTTFSLLKYSLVLKRRPEYYVFVLLLPSFLLTMLCIIGIFTPNSSGGERNEKMTLGLTTLLSMAVILNITADSMPKSATGLPLLGYYIVYEIGICALSTIFSTILVSIHERAMRNQWSPPAIIRWIAAIPSPLGCLKWIASSDDKINAAKVSSYLYGNNFILVAKNLAKNCNTEFEEKEALTALWHIYSRIDEYLKKIDEDDEREHIWASALNHIDFFLLVVLFIGNCALTASVMFRG